MDNITILEGDTLKSFLETLGVTPQPEHMVYRLRIHQRPDGLTYKINSGCWSPTIGRRADKGGY